MFTLGIPNRQYRRANEVLSHELSTPIEFESYKQEDGFWQFSFPEADEYDFRDIVMKLKSNGVTTIGADDTLTQTKIMKLTDLLKEQGSPDENDMITILKRTLESWEKPTYMGGVDSCEKSDHYFEDVKNIIEDYEEDLSIDTPSPSTLSTLQEKKLRKLIRKSIKEQSFDDRLAGKMGMSNDEFDDQIASRDIGNNAFGAAGTDKRTGQVTGDILELIKSTQIDPMDVMEAIGEEFDIKFDFSGGAPGFKKAGTDAGFDMRGL